MIQSTESNVTEEVTEKRQPTVRVSISLLDSLMNLAGELVLNRNQLLQGLSSANSQMTELSGQRIDMITSELQETIMQTRMQPVGDILENCSQLAMELCTKQRKSVDLVVKGRDVELDKSVLEAVRHPLSVFMAEFITQWIPQTDEDRHDEMPSLHRVYVEALNEVGQVKLFIGFDQTRIPAGRGTGQAVAFENEGVFFPSRTLDLHNPDIKKAVKIIEEIGGNMEVKTQNTGKTGIQIKLPPTLSIIPSQIVESGTERFAIPQVNLNELVRISPNEVDDKIKRIGDADVIQLRGDTLPLVPLARLLEIPDKDADTPRAAMGRHHRSDTAVHIAVVNSGVHKYGLMVDRLQDAEEIVVKPLGQHLKNCRAFGGATIMGDGRVALILDIANIAQMADLSSEVKTGTVSAKDEEMMDDVNSTKEAVLTFRHNEKDHFAMPLENVARIERIRTQDIETIGSNKVFQHRSGTITVYELSRLAGMGPLPEKALQEMIVVKNGGKEMGLLVNAPIDSAMVNLDCQETVLQQDGISGSVVINGHTTMILEIDSLFRLMED